MENSPMLSPEEINTLLSLSISADSNWEIIIGSPNTNLISLVKEIFQDDPQVKIEGYDDGCDFLVSIARDIPDLVIIDEHIPGILYNDIIKCIRRTRELMNIKIFFIKSSESPEVDPNCQIDEFVSGERIDNVYITRKINNYLYLSSIHKDSRRLPQKERRWPRTSLNIDARIEVIDPINGSRCDYGEAQIVNLSREGARISKIKLKKNGYILEGSFQIRLRVNQPPLENWKADSTVVSVHNGYSAGLKFIDISPIDKNKIMNFFD